MLKYVENTYLSLLEKEKEEKMELQKAKRINQELKNRLKTLEQENSELKEKFTQNEIGVITRKNDLNGLLEQLQRERRANLEESQRLQICKEQLESINNVFNELKPIKEQLNFKKSVSECLQDLLVKTRLSIAESDHTLQELHDYLTLLEYQVEKTKIIQKHGTRYWQDDFLAARLREADVILEFDRLKRDIAIIKNELEEKKVIRDAIESVKGKDRNENEGDELEEQIIQEGEKVMANTVELRNERDFLRQQLKKLEGQKEDCEKKLKQNEDIKMNLKAVRKSIWLREFETNKKVENLQEKYQKLSEKMLQELEKIHSSIEEKDLAIAKIEKKIKKIQEMNESSVESIKNYQPELTEQLLEKAKSNLEKEIQLLKTPKSPGGSALVADED